MSASTATASTSLPDAPRPGRLRRLSQLRAYTQNLSSPSGQRNRNGSRLSWLSSGGSESPGHSPTAPCPESEQPPLSRFTSAPPEFSARVMARLRSSSVVHGRTQRPDRTASTSEPVSASPEPPTQANPDLTGSTPADAATPDTAASSSSKPKQKAVIRFFPYTDTYQSSRPSLPFVPISRTLPSESCVIKVGRYSERDGVPVPNPTEPSDAPVGFKSKVVSRKHCEFLYMNGQWHVKDVGSSSGTFLNHMRLSQPNMASRLYSIKDGDIVQLGIDFRGGEEMIFRCVRIRVECNRSWQQQPNEFNKNTESLIKNLGKGDNPDYSGCRECSICLGSVLRPYQCLFMAACAHVWHYKCISRLLHSPDYPMFQCPNCRAFTDLSAEVDDTPDQPEINGEAENEIEAKDEASPASVPELPQAETHPPVHDLATNGVNHEEPDLATDVENLHLQDDQRLDADTEDGRNSDSSAPNTSKDDLVRSATSNIPGWQSTQPLNVPGPSRLRADTPGFSETSDDNPLTPRNDTGPLAFDGRAVMQ
ncbi:Zinc finger RING-type [Penicillium chermesinum]|nr:Zinc finger RING-type [Penicillium chermesinum]